MYKVRFLTSLFKFDVMNVAQFATKLKEEDFQIQG